jgi:hypothetical protein
MSKGRSLRNLHAGMLLCSVLLAATPALPQLMDRSAEQPTSIVTLAPSPKPEGALLARRQGDATFASAPANYHVFAAATAGEDAGVEMLTVNFAGATQVTRIQSKNKDFVLEGGSCREGGSYAKGDSCTLLVRFNPQGAGHRLGFISIEHSADPTPAEVGLLGNGYAPAVSFIPSVIATVPATYASGAGIIDFSIRIAVDGGDVLYIADTGNIAIREIDASGKLTTITPFVSSDTPKSVAVDTLGIIYTANTPGSQTYFAYYTPWDSQVYFNGKYDPGTCTPTDPCNLGTVGLGDPANVSMDPNDNLFLEEETKGAAEIPVSGISGQTAAATTVWYLSDSYTLGPTSFAVDANDDLYTAFFPPGDCMIVEESLYEAEYAPVANRVAGAASCGFAGDGGQARDAEISTSIGQIAFDAAGNLYFADTGNQRVRRIDYETGIIRTIAGSGTQGYSGDGGGSSGAELSEPSGVAVDSQGQVYILQNAPSAGPTQVVRQVTLDGYLNFGTFVNDTSSAAKVVVVSNTGNDDLNLSSAAFINGADASDFAIDPNTTTCVLTAGATLASGASCNVGIIFTPKATGLRSASLVFADNTVTGQNIVKLWGTGEASAPAVTITSPASKSSVNAGTVVTFAVSVTSSSKAKPTGTVTFSVNGTAIGNPVTLSNSGTASTTFSESTAKTYTLKAVYSGDSNYASTSVSETVNVTTASIKTATEVNLMPSFNPTGGCGPMSFSVQVSSQSGSPTGSVTLLSDGSALDAAALHDGTALLTARGMEAGLHSFVASYSGDSTHQPARSAALGVMVPASGPSCKGGGFGLPGFGQVP